jgi:LytS/YehU family sensor histidine kinase
MPLSKEMNFIEDYIYLHRKRFEDTLSLDYTIDGVVGDQRVPSLVFYPFCQFQAWCLLVKSFLPE